ncbi:MAG: DUF1127 domain-containing protein [Beijerinckiaceae bacterium]
MAPVLSSIIRFSRSPLIRQGLNVVRATAGAVGRVWQTRRNRRAFAALAGWDDHMLADIGLNRGVVEGALEAGFLQDPSLIVTEGTRHVTEGQFGRDLPVPPQPACMPAGCWAY